MFVDMSMIYCLRTLKKELDVNSANVIRNDNIDNKKEKNMKFEEIDQVVIEGSESEVKTNLEQIINKYHDLGYFVNVSAEALWDGGAIYTIGVMKMVEDEETSW